MNGFPDYIGPIRYRGGQFRHYPARSPPIRSNNQPVRAERRIRGFGGQRGADPVVQRGYNRQPVWRRNLQHPPRAAQPLRRRRGDPLPSARIRRRILTNQELERMRRSEALRLRVIRNAARIRLQLRAGAKIVNQRAGTLGNLAAGFVAHRRATRRRLLARRIGSRRTKGRVRKRGCRWIRTRYGSRKICPPKRRTTRRATRKRS